MINIKEERAKLKMTQKQFAEYIGFSETTVKVWETGRYRPNVDSLKKIADKLKLKIKL